MVLHTIDRVAYVARSNRADPITLERVCTQVYYKPMMFDAADGTGRLIYHTNGLMCIAIDFVLIGLEMLVDPQRCAHIVQRFEDSGCNAIPLRSDQIADFAGNAIELQGRDGRVLALSTRAAAAHNFEQRKPLEASVRLLPLAVPTIELAGLPYAAFPQEFTCRNGERGSHREPARGSDVLRHARLGRSRHD